MADTKISDISETTLTANDDVFPMTQDSTGVTKIIKKGNLFKDITIKRLETAGESLVAGNLTYLKSDGKYWKADATVDTTCSTDLLLCNATIAADATGEFIEYGEYITTGLTAGAIQYISETAGTITETQPSTSTSIVRIVGYAKSTTVLMFKPDVSYFEVA